MKPLIYSFLLSILLFSCSSEKIERNDDVQFLDRYIQLSESLFKNNGRKTSFQAKKAVADLESIVKEMKEKGEESGNDKMNEIIDLFKKVSESKDISEQRSIFKDLSEHAKMAAERVNKTLYLQYCPMAFDDTGAEWISDQKKIQNPYFGPEMPECGTTKMAYNEE